MGLMFQAARARLARWRYVYGWRLRYWWMDTPSGERTHLCAYVASLLVMTVPLIRMSIWGVYGPPPEHQEAIYPWVVQLIIAVIGAILSYALRPKTEAPPSPEHKAPVVDDGLAVDDYFGTNWIDAPALLAWKVTGRSPIKAKGGK